LVLFTRLYRNTGSTKYLKKNVTGIPENVTHFGYNLNYINPSCTEVLCMNLETTRPRGRPRNRWQDEVREDGSMVGGEEWQEKVYDREEWKKLLRTARNHCILHMPME